MADLFDLSPAVISPQSAPETFEAIVAETATGYGPVMVRIPAFGDDFLHGPCPWIPLVKAEGIFWPHEGDECAVVITSEGNPWIVGWVPATSEPDHPFDTE